MQIAYICWNEDDDTPVVWFYEPDRWRFKHVRVIAFCDLKVN